MTSNSSLALCFAAAAALTVTTAASAQKAEPASDVSSHVLAAKKQRAPHVTHRDGASAYAHTPAAAPARTQEPEKCFIEVERDHDLGYWDTCPAHGGRRVR
jgi:hypothetical protein